MFCIVNEEACWNNSYQIIGCNKFSSKKMVFGCISKLTLRARNKTKLDHKARPL
ncbi:hypothetical protein HanXRQr2_Chr09g0384761 [Helianthus annuus]|uniref:Uncharacterized protein n=1 Tax=Helianthus annuus TaxID=4232 RepID=A0A9K3I5B7_HELAN|nr:hypothetical protein HanXRQr2_Chr09g0384761 [Helianthus annuus]